MPGAKGSGRGHRRAVSSDERRHKRPLSPDRPAWFRQKGESGQAYAGFDLYCTLGHTRTQRKVADQLGKSQALISRWASAWSWCDRSDKYDVNMGHELEKVRAAEAKEQAQKMIERHVQIATNMQGIALGELSRLAATLNDPNGKRRLSPRDNIALLLEGVKLERLNREQPDSITRVQSDQSYADLVAEATATRTKPTDWPES